MQFRFIACLALVCSFCTPAFALFEPLFEEGEWTADTGLEYRYYKDPGEFNQGQNVFALRLGAEYYRAWNDDLDTLTFLPYAILDQEDSERTHFDIRELLWVHVGDDWELRSGVTRVFWGKTEFINLVDVINQQDLVDGDDEKLGQPMINLSLVHDWGIFDFFLLVGFRERTFPGPDGRLRTPIVVDTDNPIYSSDTSQKDIDFAVRWQRPVNDYVEMAFSIFSGVNREPWYSIDLMDFLGDMDDVRLIPNYHHMDQYGLELEYIYEGWAVKFEGVGVRSEREDYWAAVMGVEYSFYSLFDTNADMTFITEFMHDSRDDGTPGYLEHDVGFGGRFTFNDEFDSSMMAGFLWDPDTEEKIFSLEFERRIYSDMMLEIQAVTVLERGEPQVDDTNVEILTALAQSNLFDAGAVSYSEILEFISALIEQEGLDVIFDNQFALESLQQLQSLSDSSRKLSIIDSDDYIQIKLTYFY